MLCFHWQGRQDSNPRPAVLETAALPTELLPYLAVNIVIYYWQLVNSKCHLPLFTSHLLKNRDGFTGKKLNCIIRFYLNSRKLLETIYDGKANAV